jgi:hypothetical protein
MTVRELITELQQFPDDTLVVVDGYEGGVYPPKKPRTAKAVLNVNPESYYGSHEIEPYGTTPVCHIPRQF